MEPINTNTSFTPKPKKSYLLFYALFGLFVLAVLGMGYFYMQYNALKNPTKTQEKELQSAIKKISNLMVLPTDETPTLATVSDPDKLKDQAFFAKAQKGDKVLIYAKAKKAILYSVSMNKILEVAPFSVSNSSQ